MNNSKIALDFATLSSDEPIDRSTWLNERESSLTKILKAVEDIQTSEAWQTLKKELLDGVVQTLERRLKTEAEKKEPDLRELNVLQGQLAWARRYADLGKLGDFLRLELGNIRKQIDSNQHGKEKSRGSE